MLQICTFYLNSVDVHAVLVNQVFLVIHNKILSVITKYLFFLLPISLCTFYSPFLSLFPSDFLPLSSPFSSFSPPSLPLSLSLFPPTLSLCLSLFFCLFCPVSSLSFPLLFLDLSLSLPLSHCAVSH